MNDGERGGRREQEKRERGRKREEERRQTRGGETGAGKGEKKRVGARRKMKCISLEKYFGKINKIWKIWKNK